VTLNIFDIRFTSDLKTHHALVTLSNLNALPQLFVAPCMRNNPPLFYIHSLWGNQKVMDVKQENLNAARTAFSFKIEDTFEKNVASLSFE
jgi:hypothetical protein